MIAFGLLHVYHSELKEGNKTINNIINPRANMNSTSLKILQSDFKNVFSNLHQTFMLLVDYVLKLSPEESQNSHIGKRI